MSVEFAAVFWKEDPKGLTHEFILEMLGHFEEVAGKMFEKAPVQLYATDWKVKNIHVYLVKINDPVHSIPGCFPVIFHGFNAIMEEASEIERALLKQGLATVVSEFLNTMTDGKPHEATVDVASYETGHTVFRMFSPYNGIVDAMIRASRDDIRLIKG